MTRILESLKPGAFLVIGDLMVDEYEIGSVSRISPEAPIPVLDFTKRVRRAGGAANVAMNLIGLGNKVELVGMVGNDEAGQWLKDYLSDHGVGIAGIICVENRPTIRKVRFSSNQQSILRVDYENTNQLEMSHTLKIASYIKQVLHQKSVDGVLISDYNKGLIVNEDKSNPLIQVIGSIKDMSLLKGVDTKKSAKDLYIYKDFTFIKPNLHELAKSVEMKVSTDTNLSQACKRYLEISHAITVLVTLGEEGMFHYNGESGVHVPTVASSVYDVTGAGDTAFAVIMQSIASGLSWMDSMRLANIAASAVIESRGTQFIKKLELYRRAEIVKHTQPEYFNSQ